MEEQAEELQADRASDRRIAERLGYHVVEMAGVLFYQDAGYHGFDGGNNIVPHYTTDLNVACELTKAEAGKIGDNILIALDVHSSVQPWNCVFRNTKFSVHASAPYPALAVCRAWWAWMDTKEKEE